MNVKNELCKADTVKSCCMKAEFYGMYLFSHHLGKNGVLLNTENGKVAERFAGFCGKLTGIQPEIRKSGANKDADSFNYVVKLNSFTDTDRLMNYFGHGRNEVSLRINRANIENECCAGAFLRGAFLSCGTISNPEKGYHLEFNIKHQNLSRDFLYFLQELELVPKSMIRRSSFIVYFKESENVEDILSLMGAMKATFEIMDVKVYKSVRNKVNRLANCETANISKTVAASAEQVEAIRILKKRGMLRFLNDELRDVARLRMLHPEMSLRELGDMMSPKLSRSGVSHRLNKLIALANRN